MSLRQAVRDTLVEANVNPRDWDLLTENLVAVVEGELGVTVEPVVQTVYGRAVKVIGSILPIEERFDVVVARVLDDAGLLAADVAGGQPQGFDHLDLWVCANQPDWPHEIDDCAVEGVVEGCVDPHGVYVAGLAGGAERPPFDQTEAVEWLRERTWSFVDDEDELAGVVVLSADASERIVSYFSRLAYPQAPTIDRDRLIHALNREVSIATTDNPEGIEFRTGVMRPDSVRAVMALLLSTDKDET